MIAQYGDFFLYAPIYVAIDAGFFRERGIEVTLVSTGGDEKTWAAVLSGDAAFGVADPTFVAVAGERGQPGKVIASIVNGVPFWGVALDEAVGPISDPRALARYTVATFPAPSTAFALQAKMFRDAGLEPKIREGAPGTLIPMIRAGQAQIALELEPNVSQGVAQGGHVVYSMRGLYGDFAITGLTASPASLSRDPQLATDSVCAIQLALDLLRRDSARSLSILSHRFPEIQPNIARAALTRVITEGIIPATTTVSPEAWNQATSLRLSLGDLKGPAAATTYVDTSYSDHALRQCRQP